MNIEILKNKKLYYVLLGIIFVLAIIIRVLFLINNNVFEDDECRLIISYLDQSWLSAFLPLGDAQSAPPLYIIFQRLIGTIVGYKEFILKSVSLIFYAISFFIFFKLSESFYKNKITVLLLLFFFAINYKLIYYSCSIKQYSLDVLICLLCIYYLKDINLNNLNKKGLILLTVAFILLPLISLPSLFYIGAFFIINLVKNYSNKNFYKKLFCVMIPFILFFGFYYFYNLKPSQTEMIDYYANTWEIGFAKNGKYYLLSTIAVNLSWFFLPIKNILFLLILLGFGIYYSCKEKTNLDIYMIVVFFLVILASILNQYPFYNRVSLFSFVIILLLIFKPLDLMLEKKKLLLFLFIYLSISGYCFYDFFTKNSLKNLQIPASSKEITNILIEKYNPETDIIYVNEASASSFLFYASKKNFNSDKVYLLPKENEEIQNLFNNLGTDKKYWIYIVKDYKTNPILGKVKDNIKKYNEEYSCSIKKSNLIYFSIKK